MSAPVVLGEEIRDALRDGRGVVALETSVIAQGLPVPRNLGCIELMTSAVRSAGAVPAWVGVLDGEVRVGLDETALEAFAEPGRAAKVARRDLAYALAAGGLGATTVSSTIWAAARGGIRVGATGGIGGVHPGTGDVSADLVELSRTGVVLVCSGPKSIVDPVATAERLEELGVGIVGYRCADLPFFLAERSGVALDHRVDDPAAAGALVRAIERLGPTPALLLCNPIPAEHAMDPDEVARAVRACEAAALAERVRGKDVTPFLLRCVAERTGGRSVDANLALLGSNARLAGEVASAARSS
jgi:pseudouridine-5'-phosphate glycosidase